MNTRAARAASGARRSDDGRASGIGTGGMRTYPQHALIWTAAKIAKERAGEIQTHHYRLPADQLERLEPNAMSWRGRTNEGSEVVFTVWRNLERFAVFFEGAQKSLWGDVHEGGRLFLSSIGAYLDHNANRNPGSLS